MSERQQLLDDLARGYRVFGAFGWGDAGDGHISGRDPEQTDHFWMLRYGVPFPDATANDLVMVGPNGELVQGKGEVNRPGFMIHQPVLAARPDINSVAHTHTPWGTPFSSEARIVEPITQEACMFFEDCVVFDDEEVQVRSTGAGVRIAQCLGRNASMVLRNHGLLVVGTSVADTVVRYIYFERVAEAHLKARNPKPISAEAARFAKSALLRLDHQREQFEYLAKHHRVY